MTTHRAPHVTAQADAILKKTNILHNIYLNSLTDGSMTLEEFQRSQQQFFFAVTFFPRPMAALVGRIPDPRSRLDILHNLVEEHGDFQEELFHHTTFQKFLTLIGSAAPDPLSRPLWPALRAFNNVLTSACLLDELEVGVGCMGIIEHAFSGISAIIGRAVVERGWIRKEEMIHYSLHEQIDERHAEEFFAVVEPKWDDSTRRHFIIQGLEMGAYIFDRLYRDMYECAKST